ncbi:hypothetical protein VKT23_010588 [Stygiomarasmius scandens]|uniref:GMC oxidoreductase n=2 Tax=Marasmiellus scandens TaxID=2682957 RepID=A0ABR1JDE1_9AGAR
MNLQTRCAIPFLNTDYDWAYRTYAQSSMNNRQLSWPRGKVLGGSSTVNGMYLVRPNQVEIDAWASLASSDSSSSSSNSPWAWNPFYSAMKKAETFDAPSDDIASEAGIEFNQASYGDSGPIHWGYPGFTFPLLSSWTPSLSSLGVPLNSDPVSGNNTGSFIANSAIRKSDWTRSYSRSGYIDGITGSRSNLDILTGATVTGIVWDNSSSTSTTPSSNSNDGLKATGVQYAFSSAGQKFTVSVNKEVILSAGAVGSTQVLMVSGVGPQAVLQGAGVDVKVALEGVGARLQDHLVASLVYSTSETTAGDIHASNSAESKTAEFMSFINSATAYVPLSALFSAEDAASVISSAQSAMDSNVDKFKSAGPKGDGTSQLDDAVVEGYKQIYKTITDTFYTGGSGQVEVLIALTQPGSIILQVALQHPLSMGRMYITSPSTFDSPVLDPAYLENSADMDIYRAGVKFLRRLAGTAPLSQYIKDQTSPSFSDSPSDSDIDSFLISSSSTEFHPTGSCALLPLSLGGVVSPSDLRVYGTRNVRVVDSSVYPMELSTHLGAPTYGVAEVAVGLIREEYEASSESGGAGSDNASAGGSGGSGSGGDSSGAVGMRGLGWSGVHVVLVVIGWVLFV